MVRRPLHGSRDYNDAPHCLLLLLRLQYLHVYLIKTRATTALHSTPNLKNTGRATSKMLRHGNRVTHWIIGGGSSTTQAETAMLQLWETWQQDPTPVGSTSGLTSVQSLCDSLWKRHITHMYRLRGPSMYLIKLVMTWCSQWFMDGYTQHTGHMGGAGHCVGIYSPFGFYRGMNLTKPNCQQITWDHCGGTGLVNNGRCELLLNSVNWRGKTNLVINFPVVTVLNDVQ